MNNHKKLYIGSVTRDGSLVRVKSDHAEYQLPLYLNIQESQSNRIRLGLWR